MTFTLPRWRVLLALAATLAGSALAAAGPAQAEETAAWSAAPSDAAGTRDGRTRFELEVAPGAPLEQHLLVTNSSTVEREFAVYGADGFNTPAGGYDVGAAALAATDVGAWVAVTTPTVTIAPLSTAVVPFTVTVPDRATPGDHPGGVVVSPVRAEATDAGVLVDTRVAVRLNVRVPGEITPALEVLDVTSHYGFAAVPFTSAATTVTYEIVNRGNVKIVGVPRVRITGPFGMSLAETGGDETREVLPGDSFSVTTELPGVAPVGWAHAVVDVKMAAAPGPETEIPLVSSTARTTVLAISWTTLASVLLVVLVTWFAVRRVRRRRSEGTLMWSEMVDEARRGIEGDAQAPSTRTHAGTAGTVGAGRAVSTALTLLAGLVVLATSVVASAPMSQAVGHASAAVAPSVAADDGQEGVLKLTVPSARPTPAATRVPDTRPPVGSGVPATAPGGGGGLGSAPRSTVPDATVDDPTAPAPDPEGDGAEIVEVLADEGPAPDLLWSPAAKAWGPTQWALLVLGGVGGLAVLAAAARNLILARRPGGAA